MTERVQELKETAQRLTTGLKQTDAGVWEIDPETGAVVWTESMASLISVDPDSFEGTVEAFLNYVHPEDRSTVEAAVDHAVENEAGLNQEFRVIRADDTQRWVEIRAEIVDLGDGTRRLIGTTTDVTERKQREAELRRGRDFIEKTQQSASIGGWEVDLETAALRWTDEVYRIHDLPTDTQLELEIEEGLDFFHPDDRPTIEAAFERLVADGESYDLELRIITADGHFRWVRTVGDPQFDGEGVVVGAVGIFQDITERREREEELRKVKERLDLAIEGANLGVWDWDMQTDAVTFNDQWASMLGFSLDELDPRLDTWEDRVHPADTVDVNRALDAHIAGDEEFYECKHRMETKSGEWRWVKDVGKIVSRDDNGTPTRAVGIHLDITEETESKLELKEEREMFAEGPAIVFKWQNGDGWPVEYVSENVTETFGYTPEQLQSGAVPYADLIHDDDLDRVTREVTEASNKDNPTDRVTHDPYRVVTDNGETRWVTDSTKICRTEGEITHYLGYLTDITEQKRLEGSLRESERSVRELTSIASDTDRGFDAKLEALLKLGTERLGLPYGFLNRIGEDTQHVVQAVGDHPKLQTGATAPKSQSYCRKAVKQSTPLAIHDAAAQGWESDPGYDRFELGCYIGGRITIDGEPYGTLCFADRHSRGHEFDSSERAFVELLVQWITHELSTDVFETKLYEINKTARQLMTTPSRAQIASLTAESVQSILETSLVGIWWHDEDRDVLVPEQMTGAAATHSGEQPVIKKGTTFAWEALDAGKLRVCDDLVDDLFNEETVVNSEVIVPLGEYGVVCVGSVEHEAFSETDRSLLEVLASTIEAALVRAERETELRETQTALKQSNEELEQFAYAASHDLREPLRTVSSYLTLLERRHGEELDGDAAEFIEFAVDGADRMQNMIQALLTYSRIDIHDEPNETIAIPTLFDRVKDSLSTRITETGATVSTPSADTTVRGDPSQLIRLFQNLVDNGIKYNTGQPEIDISVRHDDEKVSFEVTDNGIGIEPEYTDGIFDVFQRLHTREEFDGTGIGLSICRKIVDRYDGEITVESQPGKGSTFRITLPSGG
jgi:PAS domain S-box